MLMDPGLESKVRLVSAITTLLQNAPELGNSQLKVTYSASLKTGIKSI